MAQTIRVQAILFDLDGVLVNSDEAITASWREWARINELDPDAVLQGIHGRRSRDTIAQVAPHLDTETESQRLLQIEMDLIERCTAYDGAKALLDSLDGHPHAVVTSGEMLLASARLRHSGMTPPAVFVTANDVSNGKPDPEGYLLAAAKLGIAPHDCVVIEDAPAGIQAAKTAGMRAIGVGTSYDPPALAAADLVIPAISALTVRFEEETILVFTAGR